MNTNLLIALILLSTQVCTNQSNQKELPTFLNFREESILFHLRPTSTNSPNLERQLISNTDRLLADKLQYLEDKEDRKSEEIPKELKTSTTKIENVDNEKDDKDPYLNEKEEDGEIYDEEENYRREFGNKDKENETDFVECILTIVIVIVMMFIMVLVVLIFRQQKKLITAVGPRGKYASIEIPGTELPEIV